MHKNLTIIIPCASGDDANPLLRVLENSLPEAICHVISNASSRAAALNKGAQKALSGQDSAWLWFLHADTIIPPDTLSTVHQITTQTVFNPQIYAFTLQFQKLASPLIILNEIGANWRSKVLKLPFGDQGFLINAPAWNILQKYDETRPYGEDLELIRRAQKSEIPINISSKQVITSARKYNQNGWLRTTLKHLYITFLESRVAP